MYAGRPALAPLASFAPTQSGKIASVAHGSPGAPRFGRVKESPVAAVAVMADGKEIAFQVRVVGARDAPFGSIGINEDPPFPADIRAPYGVALSIKAGKELIVSPVLQLGLVNSEQGEPVRKEVFVIPVDILVSWRPGSRARTE